LLSQVLLGELTSLELDDGGGVEFLVETGDLANHSFERAVNLIELIDLEAQLLYLAGFLS
jgi:hypothetical protein